MTRLRITWLKSGIGCPADQRATLRALGLRRLHQTVVKEDSSSLRGMLHKLRHLLRVEEATNHEGE